MANRKKREKGLGDQVSLFDVSSASETVADVQAEVALPDATKHIGGFVPSVPRGVPSRAVHYDKLPDVWKRGYDIHRQRLAGIQVSTQTPAGTVYVGGTKATYTVTGVLRNRRGVHGREYACDCSASVKAGRHPCKYIFAEMLANGEVEVDVTGVTSFLGRSAVRRPLVAQVTPTGQPVRSAHRAAIKEMKPLSLMLLLAIVRQYQSLFPEATLKGFLGRPETLMALKAFTLILKTTMGLSSDRMLKEYQELIDSGRVTVPDALDRHVDVTLRRPPAANTLSRWLNDERLTVVLERIYAITCIPFRMMESTVLVDSSKFSQAMFTTSRGFFYLGDRRTGSKWTVLHVAVGLESKAVLAAIVTDNRIHDSRLFRALLLRVRSFSGSVVNVMADMAYGGFEHRFWAKVQGFACLIPFKKSETGKGRGKAWVLEFVREQMDLQDKRVADFVEAYRFRVAVEGVFSMMKRMFGGYCMSHGRPRAADVEASVLDLLIGGNGVVELAPSARPLVSARGVDLASEADEDDTDVSDEIAIAEALSAYPTTVAWTNEVLCKVIAYNVRVTVHMMFHFGVTPTYAPDGVCFPKPSEPIRDVVMPFDVDGVYGDEKSDVEAS